jgi:hypothetical protein
MLQLPSSCSPLLKAEAQDELCRADYTPVSEKAGENERVRHSSAGGINLQAQQHRSVYVPYRRSLPPCQSLAKRPPRRTPPLELGRRTRSPATRRLNRPRDVRPRCQATGSRGRKHRLRRSRCAGWKCLLGPTGAAPGPWSRRPRSSPGAIRQEGVNGCASARVDSAAVVRVRGRAVARRRSDDGAVGTGSAFAPVIVEAARPCADAPLAPACPSGLAKASKSATPR